MKKINYKKIISTILLSCTVIGCVLVLSGCNNTNPQDYNYVYDAPIYNTTGTDQKAIIILPGILGSNIVNAKTGESLWSGGGLLNNIFMSNSAFDKDGRLKTSALESYFSSFLLKNADGKPTVPIRAATMNDKFLEYGIIDEYKSLYKFFNQQFGSESKLPPNEQYKVVVYQYNWTNSNTVSAEELEKFINANKYTDNILVGHNLGGLVIDYYLARSETNRNKTDGVITLGTPHLGAVGATLLDLIDYKSINYLQLLPIIKDKFGGIFDLIGNFNLQDKLPIEYKDKPEEFATYLLDSMFTKLRTMPSVYEMFATDKLIDNDLYEGNSPFNLANTSTLPSELLTKTNDFSWVKENKWIKQNIENLTTTQNSLYIGDTFVSELVDTYYIAGNGFATSYSINFAGSNDKGFKVNDLSKDIKKTTQGLMGDSMVLVESATANKPNTTNDISDHVVILDGFDQLKLYCPMSKNDDGLFPTSQINELGTNLIAIVDAIIKK